MPAAEPDISHDSHSRSSRSLQNSVPDFSDEIYGLSFQLYDEVIEILVAENQDFVANIPFGYGAYQQPDVIRYIFTICIRLRLPDDVKYFAVDIFERYMNIQGVHLFEAVAKMERSNTTKYKIWEKVEATLMRQLSLRIVSAIQISSKLHSFQDSMLPEDVHKCLKALGFPYTQEAILRSELRVLETLKFSLNSRRSPSIYVMNFLKVLTTDRKELLESINIIYQFCIFWLDYTFLNRENVYKRILAIVHDGNPVPITKDRLARVQADFSLLGCAVIIAALVSMKGPQFAEQYISDLSRITTVSEADISDASTGLVRTLLKDNSYLHQDSYN